MDNSSGEGIYFPELELRKRNDIHKELSLLYLVIKIKDNRFSISLYEK